MTQDHEDPFDKLVANCEQILGLLVRTEATARELASKRSGQIKRVQKALDALQRGTHGGARPGAGAPKGNQNGVVPRCPECGAAANARGHVEDCLKKEYKGALWCHGCDNHIASRAHKEAHAPVETPT